LGLIDQKDFKKRIKAVGGVMSSNIDSVKNSMKQSKLLNMGGSSPSQQDAKPNENEEIK
jgi:hypothetical protein